MAWPSLPPLVARNVRGILLLSTEPLPLRACGVCGRLAVRGETDTAAARRAGGWLALLVGDGDGEKDKLRLTGCTR